MKDYQVRRWSEQEFASSRVEWQQLLAASDADPLFMSWDWQWRWWKHHAGPLEATLWTLAVYSQNGELIGLAPLYARKVNHHRRMLRSTRLELLGAAWRDESAVFSEYLDLIAVQAHRERVLAAVAEWLEEQDFWGDLVFAYVKLDSLAALLARTHLARFARLRITDSMLAHCVYLREGFETFVRRLSSSARRKLFNQRGKLREASIAQVSMEEIEASLAALERFRAARWGARDGTELQKCFHLDFATAMKAENCLQLTRLTSAAETVSIMYNVRIGGTEYYLQSGYDTVRSSGLSLGYLHLGHAIESCCKGGIPRFDLLGGMGRYREYKRDLLGKEALLETYQVVRSGWLRWLYAVHGLVQRRTVARDQS